MKKLDLSNPATNLDTIVDSATKGEEIMLSRDGRPVARVVPAGLHTRKAPWTLEELRQWRKNNILGDDLTIRQLIEEGRP